MTGAADGAATPCPDHRSPPAGPAAGVDALVFDMDGLLLNAERLAKQALRRAGTELGVAIDEELCRAMIGVPADACQVLLLERYGDALAPKEFFAASTRHLHACIDAGEMQLQPGAQALLKAAQRAGMPRALATSSAREKAAHHLQRAGVAGCFDAVVTRDDVARGKPYPDLFLCAAQRLMLAPERCLALEDSYNGVRAAHAAGMPVVMVPDLLSPTPEMHQMCLAVVSDLHEVQRLIAGDLARAARKVARRSTAPAGASRRLNR